jgi:CheY-like chemotaxis protein
MIILLVNDNHDEITIFRQALKMVDRSIILEAASDGIHALGYLREHQDRHPDLIVIDVNGFFLLDKIRSNGEFAHIPVTVYTTSTNPDDIDQTIAYGASFLPKPMSYRILVTLLRKKIARLVVES